MLTGWDFTDPASPATRTIAYNADNKPTSITHSALGTTSFDYDGNGTRVKKTAGASDTFYYGSHFEIEAGAAVKYIFAGSQRIARKTAAATHYFHQDHLGSATVITDATGAQVEATEYLLFGGQRSHSGTLQAPYKFTDQELDASTGLCNYNARFYDPITGRFITADTIVPDFADPQTLNRYSYCVNSPLMYVDPSGNFGLSALLTIGAAILKGAAVGAVAGAGYAAITGGDIEQGALTGAISGAFFSAAGAYIGMAEAACTPLTTITQASIHAGAGAASGAINASIAGGDMGLGAATVAISAGFGKYVGVEYLAGQHWAVQYAGYASTGAFTGGVASVMYGGSFHYGLENGFITASYGFWFNQMGIGEKVVDGIISIGRDVGYAFSQAGRGLHAHREEIGNGFLRAGKVVIGSKVLIAGKATTLHFSVPIFQSLAVSSWAWAGTPAGQRFLMGTVDFTNSALPGVPVNNKAGRAGWLVGVTYDWLK